jgi:hypothetical protein
MSGPSPSHDFADRLEHNLIVCQKKLEETSTPSFIGKICVCQSAMVIVSDPGDQAVNWDYSFQEKEQTMQTAEGEDFRRPSEEDGDEDENNLFKEEDDLEEA